MDKNGTFLTSTILKKHMGEGSLGQCMKGVLVDAPTRVGAVGRLDMHTTGLIVTWRGPDEEMLRNQ